MTDWPGEQLASSVCRIWVGLETNPRGILLLVEMYLIAEQAGFTAIRDEIGFLVKIARFRCDIWDGKKKRRTT